MVGTYKPPTLADFFPTLADFFPTLADFFPMLHISFLRYTFLSYATHMSLLYDFSEANPRYMLTVFSPALAHFSPPMHMYLREILPEKGIPPSKEVCILFGHSSTVFFFSFFQRKVIHSKGPLFSLELKIFSQKKTGKRLWKRAIDLE